MTMYRCRRGDVMVSPNMTSFIRTIAGRWFTFHRPANSYYCCDHQKAFLKTLSKASLSILILSKTNPSKGIT